MIIKKAKECRTSILELPAELLHIIMMFTWRQDLLNFVLSNKGVIMKVFQYYRLPTLTEIRLFYLNRKEEEDADYDVFGRLVRSYGAVQPSNKRWEYPKEILSRVPNTKTLNKFICDYCMNEVNNILIEEVFKYNKEKELPHFVLAGGFVYSVVTDQFQRDKRRFYGEKTTQDVDLFVCLYGRSPESVWKDLKSILLKAEKRINEWDSGNANDSEFLKTLKFNFIKTASSLTINTRIRNDDVSERWKPQLTGPFQIVLRRVSCLEELLCLFDLDSCRFATDGKCLYSTYEGIRCLNLKCNINFPDDKGKKSFFKRAVKYGERGISTLFMDIHPLCSYFSFDEIEKCLERETKNHSFRHDDEKSEPYSSYDEESQIMVHYDIYVDQGMYHELGDVTFEDLEVVRVRGVQGLKDFESPVGDDHHSLDRVSPIISKRGFYKIQKMFQNDDVFVHNSFSDYFSNDVSIPFTSPYRKKHLFFKYDILKCPQCYTFFKTVFQDRFCACCACSKDNLLAFSSKPSLHKIWLKEIHEEERIQSARKMCRNCHTQLQSLVKRFESQRVLQPLFDKGFWSPALIMIFSRDFNLDSVSMHFLVIGGRVGVGYELSILLLMKSNRKVFITTRYPNLLKKKLNEEQRLRKTPTQLFYEVVPFDASQPIETLFKVLGQVNAAVSFAVFFCANACPERFQDLQERNKHFCNLLRKEKECYERRTDVTRLRKPSETYSFPEHGDGFKKLVKSIRKEVQDEFQDCAHIFKTGKLRNGRDVYIYRYIIERAFFENLTFQYGKDFSTENRTPNDSITSLLAVKEESEKVNNSTPECVVNWIQNQRKELQEKEKLWGRISWIVHFDTPRTQMFCEFLERKKVPLGKALMRCVKVDAKNWFEPEEWEGEQSYTDYQQAVLTLWKLCEEINKTS